MVNIVITIMMQGQSDIGLCCRINMQFFLWIEAIRVDTEVGTTFPSGFLPDSFVKIEAGCIFL